MLLDLFTKDMEEAKTLQELKDLQVKYTGKKGLIKQEMKKLAKLPVEEKKDFALQINTVRKEIEHLLYEAIQKAEQRQTFVFSHFSNYEDQKNLSTLGTLKFQICIA